MQHISLQVSLRIYYPFHYKLCKVLKLSYNISERDNLAHKVIGSRHLFSMFLGKIIAMFLVLKAARLALLLLQFIFNASTELYLQVIWDENADHHEKGQMERVPSLEIGACTLASVFVAAVFN